MKTLAEQIVIMQAALGGATIQACFAPNDSGGWGTLAEDHDWDRYPFDWISIDYRVAEPLLEGFLNLYGDGWEIGGRLHKDTDEADANASPTCLRTVHMREVREET